MEKTRNKTVRKKRPADVELIKKLIEESGVSIHRIELDLKMSKSVLLRGLQEDTVRKLPPKWELPIIKYLKKKIAENKDAEIQTEEVLIEMGFTPPEKECDLKEDLKVVKRDWVDKLHNNS